MIGHDFRKRLYGRVDFDSIAEEKLTEEIIGFVFSRRKHAFSQMPNNSKKDSFVFVD